MPTKNPALGIVRTSDNEILKVWRDDNTGLRTKGYPLEGILPMRQLLDLQH